MEQVTGVEAAFSTVLHALLRRGQGTPPYSGLSLLAKRAAGPWAKPWPAPLFLFHVFFTFYFLIFHFSITLIPTFLHVFERDPPMDLVI